MLARDADDSYIPSRAEEVELDNGKGVGAYEGGHDVFGDGSVVMCHAPGVRSFLPRTWRLSSDPLDSTSKGTRRCWSGRRPSLRLMSASAGASIPSFPIQARYMV